MLERGIMDQICARGEETHARDGKLWIRYVAYSARTAHPFRRNGAPFRFKLSKAQLVD